MSEQEINTLELSISQAKEKVNLMESLNRLLKNRDFKDIVVKGYFEKEAVRLVHLKSDPSMQTEEEQNNILKSMDAIGNFRIYLDTIRQFGVMAEKALRDDEKTREEMLAGELQ